MDHRSVGSPDHGAVELAGRLRLSVTRLARILRQQDREALGATLSSTLATVNADGPLTLGDLAAREHVSGPTLTRVVERLQEEGLLERYRDERDHRVFRVRVTTAGRRHIALARSRRSAWLAVRLNELSAGDLDCLAKAATVLERLVALVSEEAEQ